MPTSSSDDQRATPRALAVRWLGPRFGEPIGRAVSALLLCRVIFLLAGPPLHRRDQGYTHEGVATR
jgi:hypothetical protein